jgi:hypothetical protein
MPEFIAYTTKTNYWETENFPTKIIAKHHWKIIEKKVWQTGKRPKVRLRNLRFRYCNIEKFQIIK